MTAFDMKYRIISTNCKAFWSNDDGWVGLKGATVFSKQERETLNLPCEGCWVPAESMNISTVKQLAQFLDYLPQSMKVASTFSHVFTSSNAGLTIEIIGLDEFDLPIRDDDCVRTYGLHCWVRM
jgi:hypothetical protein